MDKIPRNLKDIYECIEKDSNYLFVLEIEIDEGIKVPIFQEIWKKFLTVPMDPFTDKFHTKFLFDIDKNGLGKRIFSLVNDYVLSTDEFKIFNKRTLFRACAYNQESTIEILTYLGMIRFIITHFTMKINYSVYGNNLKSKEDADVYNFPYLMKFGIIISQGDSDCDVLKMMGHAFLKLVKWIYEFLIKNEENYDEYFLKKTIEYAELFDIDLCTSMLFNKEKPKNNEAVKKTPVKKNSKSNGRRELEPKKSWNSIVLDMNKIKTDESWKFEVLKTKPHFGIINGFGSECQTIIEHIFPHKIAMFMNALFTNGLGYIYSHIDQFEIEDSFVMKEKLIRKKLDLHLQNINDSQV